MRSSSAVTAGGLILILAVLSGCATMSQAECQNTNWQIRGEDDGSSGYRRDRVNEHTKACAEFGIKPDVNAYSKGWETSIRKFCTREKGWEHGLSGKNYQNSCPEGQQAEFFEAYKSGSSVYDQQTALTSLETQLVTVNSKLDDVEDDDSKRKKLKKRRTKLKEDLAEAEIDLLRLQLELQKKGFTLP